jgi:hypothetical protein
MSVRGQNDEGWHPETITPATGVLLGVLRDQAVLGDAYLARGTGLALRFGHRRSVDLDFFSPELFNEEVLLQRLQPLEGVEVVERAPHTLHLTIGGVKVSFLGYTYPVLFPLTEFHGVPVADPRDIACMKITAIASRGTKRDFVDFYAACKRFALDEIFDLFGRKYARTGYNKLHILKSLTYFSDAEKDPMPHMLTPLDWDLVKRFFLREVPRLR